MATQISESLLSALGSTLQGTLHTDTVMKTLYATDASAYREMPLGVAIPETQQDKNTDIATLGLIGGFIVMMMLDVALG